MFNSIKLSIKRLMILKNKRSRIAGIMAAVKNLKFRFLLLFVFVLLSNQSQHLQASPWAIPGNLILRQEENIN